MNNEIQLPVAELKQALPGFTKIIAKKNTLPALGCLRLSRSSDGDVLLQATNLDDFASVKLSMIQPGNPVDLLIPFDPLARFTKSSGPEDNLKLLPGDSESVLVYPLGNTFAEQKLQTLAREEWPSVPTVNQPAITLDDRFKTTLQKALDCASEDETRKVLNGACLDVSEKNSHYVVGTDGRHLFSANSFAFDLEESLIIPSRKFLAWAGFLQDGPWKLSVKAPEKEEQPGWIQIESDKWTFITRQIEGKYPNWRLPFPDPAGDKTTVKLSDKAVEFLLTVVPKLPGDHNHQSVALAVEDGGKFLVKGRNNENDDWTSISVEDVQVTGNPTTVSINRAYLVKALKLGLNELQLRDACSPVVICSGGQRLLIAPVNYSANSVPPQPQQATPTPASTATAPTTPPPQQPEPSTEEQHEPTMKTVNRLEPTETNNGDQLTTEEIQEKISALQQAGQQVEKIKDSLKTIVSDLADVLKVITQAQKEKRATEKEIETFRDSLRALQKVKI